MAPSFSAGFGAPLLIMLTFIHASNVRKRSTMEHCGRSLVSAFKVWLISHLPSPIKLQITLFSSLLESLIPNVDGKDVVPALHKRPTQVPLHNHTLDGSCMVLHREKIPRNGRCKALHRSHYHGKRDRLLRPWSLRRSLLKGS